MGSILNLAFCEVIKIYGQNTNNTDKEVSHEEVQKYKEDRNQFCKCEEVYVRASRPGDP